MHEDPGNEAADPRGEVSRWFDRLEANVRADNCDLGWLMGFRSHIETLLASLAARADQADRTEEALRKLSQPLMDERFRDRLLRHALSNNEVGDLVDAIYARQNTALAALAVSVRGRPEGDEAG